MSETRQIDDVIRTMAVDVGKISITQAVIVTKQDLMHVDVKKINSRVTSLEKIESENIGSSKKLATIKKSIAWGLGLMTGVAGLIFGIMRMLQ